MSQSRSTTRAVNAPSKDQVDQANAKSAADRDAQYRAARLKDLEDGVSAHISARSSSQGETTFKLRGVYAPDVVAAVQAQLGSWKIRVINQARNECTFGVS